MKKRVLVTAIGSASANCVIKSIKKQYDVIGTNIYSKEYISNSLLVDKYYEVPRALNQTKYAMAIKNICIDEKCEYVVPLTDPEIDALNRYRAAFEKSGITLCFSDECVINVCRNKRKTAEILNRIEGINCIPELSIEKAKESFPVVFKLVNGRSSEKQYITNNLVDFEYALNCIENLDDYIIQPFIRGDVVTVDILRNLTKIRAVARKELMRTPNGLGLSVKILNDDKIIEVSEKIADTLGVIGCACLEYIQDYNGDLWFLECNPRFSGGVSFSCLAGYDFPANHMRSFTEEIIDDMPQMKEMYMARHYVETVTSDGELIHNK